MKADYTFFHDAEPPFRYDLVIPDIGEFARRALPDEAILRAMRLLCRKSVLLAESYLELLTMI